MSRELPAVQIKQTIKKSEKTITICSDLLRNKDLPNPPSLSLAAKPQPLTVPATHAKDEQNKQRTTGQG